METRLGVGGSDESLLVGHDSLRPPHGDRIQGGPGLSCESEHRFGVRYLDSAARGESRPGSRHRDDPAQKRNLALAKAPRPAAPVPALIRVQGDERGLVQI
jgi:hypothetical protein